MTLRVILLLVPILLWNVQRGWAAESGNPDHIQQEMDSLAVLRDALENQMRAVAAKIDSLQVALSSKLAAQLSDSAIFVPLRGDTRLYAYPSGTAPTVCFLERGALVRVYRCVNDMFAIALGKKRGFIPTFEVEQDPRTDELKARCFEDTSYKQHERAQEEAEGAKVVAARRQRLLKQYDQDDAERIAKQQIWIGMTSQMALSSWGQPEDINRTVTANMTHEQWIYGRTYLYFENGILTGWQEW